MRFTKLDVRPSGSIYVNTFRLFPFVYSSMRELRMNLKWNFTCSNRTTLSQLNQDSSSPTSYVQPHGSLNRVIRFQLSYDWAVLWDVGWQMYRDLLATEAVWPSGEVNGMKVGSVSAFVGPDTAISISKGL